MFFSFKLNPFSLQFKNCLKEMSPTLNSSIQARGPLYLILQVFFVYRYRKGRAGGARGEHACTKHVHWISGTGTYIYTIQLESMKAFLPRI